MDDSTPIVEDGEGNEESDEDIKEQSLIEADREVYFYWHINPRHFRTLYDAVAEVREMKGTPIVPAETGTLRRPPPKYFVIPGPMT